MTLYVHYDSKTNDFLGFYDTEIHNSIPKPNIKITIEQHKMCYDSLSKGINFELDGIKLNPFKTITQDIDWDDIRHKRNIILQKSDWTQLDDVPENIKTKYKKYRQALRDIPQTYKMSNEIVWPIEPI